MITKVYLLLHSFCLPYMHLYLADLFLSDSCLSEYGPFVSRTLFSGSANVGLLKSKTKQPKISILIQNYKLFEFDPYFYE